MPVKPANCNLNSNTDTILTIGDSVFDLANHTPMMVQYLTLKVKYPQALLLYRMGDFYELFFDDAKCAAQILDITLTRRGNDKAGNSIAMAGVPFHAADSYMARLIAAGQTVVVCEQIDESATHNTPVLADKQKKNSTTTPNNGIMRREVVKTLTAGTITDDALIAPNHTPTVVAIDIEATMHQTTANSKSLSAAISQLDLAAGTLTTQTLEVENQANYAEAIAMLQTQMLTVLARFAPSECIVSEAIDEQWMIWLRRQLDCPIIEVAATDFHRDHATATLCQQFAVQRLDGLGINNTLLAQSSCAALIHYARQTQQRQIPQVNQLIVEFNDDYLIIDAGSQQNLEIFTPVTSNGTSLISVLNHCQTPMGKRLLVQQMKRPLRQHARINLRLQAISELLSADHSTSGYVDASLVSELRHILSTIGDIERISSRIGLMSAKPRDLRKLADGIVSSMEVASLLTTVGIDDEQLGLLAMLMQQLPEKLPNVQEVAKRIERAIIAEPPAHIRDGGMLATGFDADLDRLTHLHDNIQATLDTMAEQARLEHQLPSLKVGFNKVSGFYFELPKMQAQHAPVHFIRRQTLKNAERFITEELKELETEYLSAQTLALAREKQLYHQLLTELSQHLAELQQLSAAIAQLDVLSNWANLAISYNWQRPIMNNGLASEIRHSNENSANLQSSVQNQLNFDNDEVNNSNTYTTKAAKTSNLSSNQSQTPSKTYNSSIIDIGAGRHVVVEAVLDKADRASSNSNRSTGTSHFVANDCQLGTIDNPERLLLITGPNMGGKSTYMRQTALIVLLAHCGSFVPAAEAYIGDIDRIFTRIGSADDLAGGKSTFMVEMIETANILNQATNKSLVLMDEVGRGTATTDGLAIAHACVNKLLEIGCLTLFATHYFELTQLANDNQGIRNVHVAASEVDGQLLLLHKIKDGAASSSFGLHVAKMAGIPPAVLADAKRYLIDNLMTNQATNKSSLISDDISINSKTTDDKIELTNSVKDKRQQRYSTEMKNIDSNFSDSITDYAANIKQNQWFELQSKLDNIDPDSLTPKQAHDMLYTLKQLINR